MSKKIDFRSRLVLWGISFLKKIGQPKPNSSSLKKILVVSTTGVGDTLWSTPALSLLRQKLPHSHISVLTSPLGAQVLKNNPNINELIPIRKSNICLLWFYFILKPKQFDTILIFHISDRWLIPFCYLLAPQKLLGFHRHAKVFAPLLSHSYEVGLTHPIMQRISLLESLGISGKDHQIKIFLSESEQKLAQDFLQKYHLSSESLLVGIQPGASQAFKQWPLEHFIELCKKLWNIPHIRIIIFGSKSEMELGEKIREEVEVIVAAGALSLRGTAALISKMDLFISNDTGPMHLALAQKIPIVSIFSPTPDNLCWPHLEAPWFTKVVKPKTCEVCIGHRCKKPYCMERIHPEEVYEAAKNQLALRIQQRSEQN